MSGGLVVLLCLCSFATRREKSNVSFNYVLFNYLFFVAVAASTVCWFIRRARDFAETVIGEALYRLHDLATCNSLFCEQIVYL